MDTKTIPTSELEANDLVAFILDDQLSAIKCYLEFLIEILDKFPSIAQDTFYFTKDVCK